jgi:cytochrome c553
MKNADRLIITLCAAAVLCLPIVSHAQAAAGGAGAEIAARGAPNGVAACASCHGAHGEGNAAANFPRIAGQPAAYLARQLASYADGSRANPVMAPIAKGLSRDQMEAVATYYAALAAPAAAKAAGQPPAAKQLARGRLLAGTGDESKGIQGCANCHGPGGSGLPPSYPYLAGQHRAYLTTALAEWKSGARNTDSSKQMPSIAKRLSDDDIAAVSGYYALQAPPRPAADRINVPVTAAAQPAPGPGPQSAGPAPQGVGTGQGEATSGGAQGPGGGGGGTAGSKDNH